MRKPLPILFLLLAGCGGGGPSSPATFRGGGGSAQISVAWPARTRLVPLSSDSATVELTPPKGAKLSKLLVRVGDGASVGRALFKGLVAGRYAVAVRTFPSRDGTGVAQAAGVATLEIDGRETATLTAAPDSTVATLALSAPSPSVEVGGTLAITASAKDKDGNLVLLASDGIQERLDWSVAPAGSATLQGTGPTAALTGVSAADATVTARLKVKDDGTTVAATLPVKVARKATGLATAGWPARGGDYGAMFAGRGPAASGTLGSPIVVGGYRSPPAVVVGSDGTLYTGSDTKVAAQGAVNWEVANAAGDVCRSLALTQGGVLLAGNDKGIFARDAATGALLWSSPLVVTRLAVGRDGTVYVCTPSVMHALDGATGADRWMSAHRDIQAIGDDGTLYGVATESTGTHNDVTTNYYARAWEPSNGAVRWSKSLGTSSRYGGFGAFGLAVAGNLVYLKTYQNVPLNSSQRIMNGHVLALRTSDGSRAWIYDFASATADNSGFGGGVSVRGGTAFADWKGRAVALDALTGAKRWDVYVGDGAGTATAADGTLYCLVRGLYSSLSLRALDPQTGLTRWQTEPVTGSGDASPLALADDGTVYFAASYLDGNGSGRVYPVR